MVMSLIGRGVDDVFSRFAELEALQGKVRGHIDSINELFSRISRAVGGRGKPGRKPGRPAGSRGRPAKAGRVAAKRGRPAGGGRAKRGALKEAIHKVLAGGKVAKPIEIVNALPKAGFRSASTPKVLYTTVYLSLKKDSSIQKTADGFKLKAGAGKKATAKAS